MILRTWLLSDSWPKLHGCQSLKTTWKLRELFLHNLRTMFETPKGLWHQHRWQPMQLPVVLRQNMAASWAINGIENVNLGGALRTLSLRHRCPSWLGSPQISGTEARPLEGTMAKRSPLPRVFMSTAIEGNVGTWHIIPSWWSPSTCCKKAMEKTHPGFPFNLTTVKQTILKFSDS